MSETIYLAGHTGLVGRRDPSRPGAPGRLRRASSSRDVADVDMTDQAATRAFFAARAARRRDHRRGQGRRHHGQLGAALGVRLPEPGHRGEPDRAPPSRSGVRRLIFLGSSCIYPREAPQPLKEEYLLTGPLEETNRAYAIAKIAGIELCRSLNREYGTDYLSLMPTNLYGPGDNFDLAHEPRAAGADPPLPRGQARPAGRAGRPRDAARPGHPLGHAARPGASSSTSTTSASAVVFCLEHVSAADVPDGLLNVGCGEDLTIRELAALVQRVVGHRARSSGTPRSPTARRASSWTSAACAASAGARRCRSRRASRARTNGSGSTARKDGHEQARARVSRGGRA